MGKPLQRRYSLGVKTNGKVVPLRRQDNASAASAPAISTLARLIAAYAPYDDSFELRIPGVHAGRMSRANTQCFHTLRLPSLCIAAQGAKTVIVGKDTYEYDASRMIVFSVALPIASQITRASHSEPYLSLRLDLDPRKIAELILKVYPQGLPPVQERSAVYVAPQDPSIINAVIRLMECLSHPGAPSFSLHSSSTKF
jgi:AraC-type transcriptional regulator N-terminus